MKDSGYNFNVSSSIHSLAKNENFETRDKNKAYYYYCISSSETTHVTTVISY
jgi:hypothetical protein